MQCGNYVTKALHGSLNKGTIRKDGLLRGNRVTVQHAQERRHMHDAVPVVNEPFECGESLRIYTNVAELDPVRRPKCALDVIVALKLDSTGLDDSLEKGFPTGVCLSLQLLQPARLSFSLGGKSVESPGLVCADALRLDFHKPGLGVGLQTCDHDRQRHGCQHRFEEESFVRLACP